MKTKQPAPRKIKRAELKRSVYSLVSNYGVTGLQQVFDDYVTDVFDVGCSSPIAVAQLVQNLQDEHKDAKGKCACLVLFVLDKPEH